MDLREHRIRSRQVFSGKLLDVRQDTVETPSGAQAVREYIRHPGAALIAPLYDNNELQFIRQFRYPVGETMVELPAGKLDAGEAAQVTAHRELLEETGLQAGELIALGLIHPCIGYSDEVIHLFLARQLTQAGAARPDVDEFLQPFRLSLEEALIWIRQGRITDVKTIIALYRTRDWLAENRHRE